MEFDTCADCGRSLDAHDRNIKFALPDPVLDAGEIDAADMWMSGPDAKSSSLMQVQNVGAFVRALLPVTLTDEHVVTYGVWIAIDPAELGRVFDVWWKPEYRDLVLDGYLANSVQPWGLLGSPVSIAVRDPETIPYCTQSSADQLQSVIADTWNHDLVLAAYWGN